MVVARNLGHANTRMVEKHFSREIWSMLTISSDVHGAGLGGVLETVPARRGVAARQAL